MRVKHCKSIDDVEEKWGEEEGVETVEYWNDVTNKQYYQPQKHILITVNMHKKKRNISNKKIT